MAIVSARGGGEGTYKKLIKEKVDCFYGFQRPVLTIHFLDLLSVFPHGLFKRDKNEDSRRKRVVDFSVFLGIGIKNNGLRLVMQYGVDGKRERQVKPITPGCSLMFSCVCLTHLTLRLGNRWRLREKVTWDYEPLLINCPHILVILRWKLAYKDTTEKNNNTTMNN